MGDPSADLDALEKRVEEIEKTSRAEVVVAVARASSDYHDTVWMVVTIVSFIAWFAILFLPYDFDPVFVIPNLLLIAVLTWFAVARTGLRRLLTPRGRRRAAAERAARLVFVDENVSATRDRVGVLIFFSALEGEVEIVADHGVAANVEEARWNPIRLMRLQGEPLRALHEVLDAVGAVLAERLPRDEPGDDELPNHPRVLGVVR